MPDVSIVTPYECYIIGAVLFLGGGTNRADISNDATILGVTS